MDTQTEAREKIIQAFESLLIHAGERAATLRAVAMEAGLSKGGLLYHFPNKESLIAGLLDRLESLAADDLSRMAASPEGAATHFIKTSIWTASPMDRALIATTRLIEVANKEARLRLTNLERRWLELISYDVGDTVAKAVLYMGHGLYFNALWRGEASGCKPSGREEEAKELLLLLQRMQGHGQPVQAQPPLTFLERDQTISHRSEMQRK